MKPLEDLKRAIMDGSKGDFLKTKEYLERELEVLVYSETGYSKALGLYLEQFPGRVQAEIDDRLTPDVLRDAPLKPGSEMVTAVNLGTDLIYLQRVIEYLKTRTQQYYFEFEDEETLSFPEKTVEALENLTTNLEIKFEKLKTTSPTRSSRDA